MSYSGGQDSPTTSTTFTRGGSAEETGYLPVSVAFDVLADERRRHLLYYLVDEAGGAATPSELAEHLLEVDPRPVAVDHEAIVADLHHRHLPKLKTNDLVAREGRDGVVRYRGDPFVEECLGLAAIRDFERR